MDHDAYIREGRHQLVRCISANSHETTRAERYLTAVADQNIEADCSNRVDQERNKQRVCPVVVDDERDHQIGNRQNSVVAIAVKLDREGLVIRTVACLKVACFTVEHQTIPPSRWCSRGT